MTELAVVFAVLFVMGLSLRWPSVAVATFLSIGILLPLDTYHQNWGIAGPWGSFDVMDMITGAMLAVSAFRTGASGFAVGRGFMISAGVVLIAIVLAFVIGNAPNQILNDVRPVAAALAVAWFFVTANASFQVIGRLVWISLAVGVAGIALHWGDFADALADGSRATADAWIRPLLPGVMMLGWPIASLTARRSWARRGVWGLIALVNATAVILSLTRGYMAGIVASLATATLFAFWKHRTWTMMGAVLALAIVLGRDGTPDGHPANRLEDALGERFTWDDSAVSRTDEMAALVDQSSALQIVLGHQLGGTYDASTVHPDLPFSDRMSYTHMGWAVILLKFGIAGVLMVLAGMGLLARRLVRAARSGGDIGMLGGIASAAVAFAVCNAGDPVIIDPVAVAFVGVVIAAATRRADGRDERAPILLVPAHVG